MIATGVDKEGGAAARLGAQDFRRICELVYRASGITLSPLKHTMVETRLRKRLKALQLGSFAEYSERLFASVSREQETVALLDSITVNKTDFFREPDHFHYLVSSAIPALMANGGCGLSRPLAVWSAGCSTGEEPYTLAILLSEFRESQRQGSAFRFSILATDLSTKALDTARRAVYSEQILEAVPQYLRHKYFLRSRDRSIGLARLTAGMRDLVEFKRLNLAAPSYGISDCLDAVFCRNVMIYFDSVVRAQVVRRLVASLRRGGYFFIGHSETLNGMDLPVESMAPAIYRKA